jgi:hypothetical protein
MYNADVVASIIKAALDDKEAADGVRHNAEIWALVRRAPSRGFLHAEIRRRYPELTLTQREALLDHALTDIAGANLRLVTAKQAKTNLM